MRIRYSREDLHSAAGLMSALRELFPDFADAELIEDVQSGEASLHTVMLEFSCSFDASKSDDRQLAALASLMEMCVSGDDDLENAVGTCFLEHLRQKDRRRLFLKHLSRDVKAYIRTH